MKDWILIAFLIPLAAIALGLFGFVGMQGFIWDRAYDHALSTYKEAYAHRNDPQSAKTLPSYQEYMEAEERLESIRTTDAERLERFKNLRECGLSLKGYRDLRANGFDTASFEKAAAACTQ